MRVAVRLSCLAALVMGLTACTPAEEGSAPAGAKPAAPAPAAVEYPGQSNYDTTVYPDEALVNLRIRNHRWPDCYSLETAIADMFRIEGVDKAPDADEAKALALWRWVMTLTGNNASRIFEGNPTGKWKRDLGDPAVDQIEIRRSDKVLMVYGMHECGGLSRVIADLWCAAGYLGYQEASSGHSTASLRYPDATGRWRMHSFNPVGRSYYWNERDKCVGLRARPIGRSMELKPLRPPMEHTLRTGLRQGEVVRRRWENEGYVQKTQLMLKWAGQRGDNKRILGLCCTGQEDQTFEAVIDPAAFRGQLWPGSENVACSAPGAAGARLHPQEAGKTAAFIYRLASPYVALESTIEAKLRKGAEGDLCRLSFSTDGGRTWHVVHEQKQAGAAETKVAVGQDRYWKPEPSITSYYSFLVKAEFRTDGEATQVGMDRLKVVVHRQLNMRALPNLMPGENVFQITADALRPGLALKLTLDYEVNGKPVSVTQCVTTFPHYFRVSVEGLPEKALLTPLYLANWGQPGKFNLASYPLRMRELRLELVPRAEAQESRSLPAAEAEALFRQAFPTPYKCDRRKPPRAELLPRWEGDASGFFPQIPRQPDQPKDPREYYNWLVDNLGTSDALLPKAGPEVRDVMAWCIEQFPKAHNLHTLGFCNVFAEFKEARALPVLLEKWKAAPRNAPGDRYIPDALAAIGDRSTVPALVGKMKELRMDYRVHIARALGLLGGEEAKKALRTLVKEDPCISVRGEAERALKVLDKEAK